MVELRGLLAGFPLWQPKFDIRSSHVGVAVDKEVLRQVSLKYFGFPSCFSIHQILHTHVSSRASATCKFETDIPSRLSLTPLHEMKKKKTLGHHILLQEPVSWTEKSRYIESDCRGAWASCQKEWKGQTTIQQLVSHVQPDGKQEGSLVWSVLTWVLLALPLKKISLFPFFHGPENGSLLLLLCTAKMLLLLFSLCTSFHALWKGQLSGILFQFTCMGLVLHDLLCLPSYYTSLTFTLKMEAVYCSVNVSTHLPNCMIS